MLGPVFHLVHGIFPPQVHVPRVVGTNDVLDWVLQQHSEPDNLCLFQPRLQGRLQGDDSVRVPLPQEK